MITLTRPVASAKGVAFAVRQLLSNKNGDTITRVAVSYPAVLSPFY
jgi:hypothetical protein